MYCNNVIESHTDLSGEIFGNFVWPQESYLTSVPTTFVRGPEIYSVESGGTTYFFQSAVPINSVSFENSVWPQDSYLQPVPTNCFFVRGPEVCSIETGGTTYYYQRAVPVSIASDLDFHLHNDCGQELFENTDLLNDVINNYDIVNSSASSLSSSVDIDTGNRDSDLESAGSSYILHVTENLGTDLQQNGNVLDWSVIDETLTEFYEDNNGCTENCNDVSSEILDADVQQNGNVQDWSVIDETLTEFYEDNNVCTENCNDGSSEIHGTDVQQNGNVLDWSVIDETLTEFYEDYNVCIENCNDGSSENNAEIEVSTSDSLSEYDTKALNKCLRDRLYLIALSGHLYQKESIPVVDILPIIEEEFLSDVEDYDSESRKICGKSPDKINSSTGNIILISSDKDLIKTTEKISSTVEYFKPRGNSIFKESKTESSSQENPELNKDNIPRCDKIIPLDDESYCFEENPMFKESNLKSSNEEYSQLNKKLILTFDKITPPNDKILCLKEDHTLPSGDKDLVKTAEKLSSTNERDEFQTSKLPTSEGTNSEENITVSGKDLLVEGSSSLTASTEMKNPKKKKRFQKLRKWIATRLLRCGRKNASPKE